MLTKSLQVFPGSERCRHTGPLDQPLEYRPINSCDMPLQYALGKGEGRVVAGKSRNQLITDGLFELRHMKNRVN